MSKAELSFDDFTKDIKKIGYPETIQEGKIFVAKKGGVRIKFNRSGSIKLEAKPSTLDSMTSALKKDGFKVDSETPRWNFFVGSDYENYTKFVTKALPLIPEKTFERTPTAPKVKTPKKAKETPAAKVTNEVKASKAADDIAAIKTKNVAAMKATKGHMKGKVAVEKGTIEEGYTIDKARAEVGSFLKEDGQIPSWEAPEKISHGDLKNIL